MKFLEGLIEAVDGDIISGLTKELNVFCVLDYFNKNEKNVIVLTSSLYEANMYYDALCTYTDKVSLFPMDDFLTSVAIAVSPDLKVKRLETLEEISHGKRIVVTNLMGYLRYLPNKNYAGKLAFKLKKGDALKRENFLNALEQFGYTKTSIVSSTGEYAVRGFVVDIFLIGEEHPIRIEFFGDVIDDIRYFDENTQLSVGEISEIECKPYREIETDTKSSLVDYLQNPMVFKINATQIEASYEKLVNDILDYKASVGDDASKQYMFDMEEITSTATVCLNNFKSKDDTKAFSAREILNFDSDFERLSDYLKDGINKGKTAIICLSSKQQIDNMTAFIKEAVLTNERSILPNKINVINKKINMGFEFANLIVIGEKDLDKSKHSIINYKNSLKIGKKIKDFSQLVPGDYVVHTLHGIGVYNGVITLTKNGLKKDYIQINYQGNDKVYIPVEKISTIYKYSSRDGSAPHINKLNSTSWAKTKRELRKKINDISKELIELYAARAKVKGEAYKSFELEDIFASKFPYEETKDQTKAIREIDKDLLSSIPMDRLLCGDVGFGKTEVAFRAIFKAVANNKQVFYLCPTTILSKQQYTSAIERFKDFPVEIALLNRFTTKKETERILAGLENGTIDIVFGTHRLLSDDVKFKKLGLLIVDEEQRFGVTHKEKIKKYKNDVNVLTLSATPIPRTLKMALSGLRDLSIIDTPPVNRYPVQTYVMAENDALIKDAIYKEMARKGQVFVLYNKVESIEQMVNHLQELVPEARITYAHGQMNKTELEDVMQAFIDYEFDILVCTTIIETGIDIPNANTLIIFDADHFGLSQLYQIRGRVGRSNRIAYAYLFYNKSKMLNDVAVKRLEAIKEFTELGSGYRIAMRDLSIRGAGDILGSEQAGFVDSVGIELYMKMVDEEIRRLNGEEVPEEDESSTNLIDVETHISDAYVSDEDLKIEIHKKINEIDSYDKLNEVKAEIEDRFGKLPQNILIYMLEEWFEKLALKLGISRINQSPRNVEIEIPEEISNKLKGDKLLMKALNINPKFNLRYQFKRVYISLNTVNLEKHFLYYLIELLEEVKSEVDDADEFTTNELANDSNI